MKLMAQQHNVSGVAAPSGPIAAPLNFPLVMENGFRAFGVPASASRADLLAAGGAIRRALKLAVARPTDWDLPWLGRLDRTEASLQNATGRLADVEKRLIDRLFWFGPDATDLVKLRPGAAPAGLAAEAGARPDRNHDVALLMVLHAAAADPLFADLPRWQAAIAGWQKAVNNDDYWKLVLDQDRQGNFEPVANADDVR